MNALTRRGLTLIGVAVLIFFAAMALTAASSDGVRVVGSMLGLLAALMIVVGVVLAAVGAVRNS